MKKILIVEDNLTLTTILTDWMEKWGYEVFHTIEEPAARKIIKAQPVDFVLADVRLSKGDGISLLKWMHDQRIYLPYVIMTDYGQIPDAVRATKMGALDYLSKPVHSEHLQKLLDENLHPVHGKTPQHPEFLRQSAAMQRIYQKVGLMAPVNIAVLISGENGTGKELIAQSIHWQSPRKDKPFVAVNCGGISTELALSEFFGHVKGAFTGADTHREGCFHEAAGGTIFLDEIGNMPMAIQNTLLRVLQEGEYTPVGSNKPRKTDVRIISATNANLLQDIKDGKFREDLYHRLKECSIKVPPLRDCMEDILPLAEHFLHTFREEFHARAEGFDEKAKEKLLAYHWPGNVRELRHCVKQAVLLAQTPLIGADSLELEDDEEYGTACTSDERDITIKSRNEEIRKIKIALEACAGNKTMASEMLDIGRTSLYRKIKEYGIERDKG